MLDGSKAGSGGQRMSRSRLMGWLAGIVALVCLVIGGAAVKWYVWDVVIGGAGEADRSMLFWGLPILFIGVWALGGGVGLGLVARNTLNQRAAPDAGE